MPLLKEKDRLHLYEEFKALQHPVKLVVFTQQFECEYCRETREIAQEVAELGEKIDLEVYDFDADKGLAAQYGVDKIPALLVVRGGDDPKDFGIRFYGIPAGYEFTSLIHAVMMVGTGDSGLSPELKAWAAALKEPVHLQVFVTPTCPYCPQAVVTAHRLALESEFVRGDMVEATEFPHLAIKYNVMGVPRTVINEEHHIEGALPERMLLDQLQATVG